MKNSKNEHDCSDCQSGHDNKSKIIRRLKLVEGQIRGLQKMIETDVYCINIITQTSAVKQALSNVEDFTKDLRIL